MNSTLKIVEHPFEGNHRRFQVYETVSGRSVEIGVATTRVDACVIRDARQHEINKRLLDRERG